MIKLLIQKRTPPEKMFELFGNTLPAMHYHGSNRLTITDVSVTHQRE